MAQAAPTLWIVGDSTVRNGKPPGFGWGEVIAPYFDSAAIGVQNKAIGGRSSRTFRAEGKWAGVLSGMKPGDVVFVQFGHNDVGAIDDKGKFRGSLKGTGDESQKVKKPDGSEEEVQTYGWYMKKYVTEAKDKGATVIIFTPIPHNDWDGSKLKNDFVDMRNWLKEVATQTGAPLVDLTAIVSAEYAKLGKDAVKPLFADPRTHTTKEGAELNARSVIAGLKALPGDPMGKYFSPQAASVPAGAP